MMEKYLYFYISNKYIYISYECAESKEALLEPCQTFFSQLKDLLDTLRICSTLTTSQDTCCKVLEPIHIISLGK